MDDVNLRKKIDTTFKLYGFNLRRDAQTFLVDQLRPVASAERQEWLERFTESIQKLSPESAVIEKSLVETAVQECLRSGLDKTETVFNVISSFEVPRFLYDLERKKFMKSSEPSPEIFGPPIDKAAIYRDRYTVLQQRTARHELFTPAVAGGGGGGGGDADAPQKFRLSPVEYLLSCAGRQDDVVVLGMLAQLREGRFFLEDPTGVVQLDLSQAYHTGLFCENCFVLAEGWYDDRIFHIQGLGFPPAESSKSSRAYFGNVNTFGGPSVVSLKTSSNLLKHEQENQDAMIVFLADVWLDSFKVMDKLRQLFAGYAECPPVAFVLMGSFLSAQGGGGGQARLLRARLRALADLVLQFPELARRSRFVLVPGPVDPACPGILPRPALPAHVAEEFLSRLPSAELATNPCRLQYCTQEIVVARQDLVTKLCRNTVHFPASGEIADHFAKTILCQAHLTPLPLSVCPLYWGFDAALRLYPLPDLVVVGDTFSAFTSSYMGCVVSNPGSFPKSEFSFKVYIPATRQMEDSQLPND